jgi:hypothetical protein
MIITADMFYNHAMLDFLIIGRWLAIVGVCLVITGGFVYLLGKFGGFSQLPGTLHFEGQGFTCIIPILGSIVLSIVLTVLFNLAARWLK